MKINILGTVYDFLETTAKEDNRLCDKDGFSDFYKKVICVETDYNENDQNAIRNFTVFKNKIKRHEIIHTYLYESGMREWSENELFVDWIAIQFPKILETFKEIGVL